MKAIAARVDVGRGTSAVAEMLRERDRCGERARERSTGRFERKGKSEGEKG